MNKTKLNRGMALLIMLTIFGNIVNASNSAIGNFEITLKNSYVLKNNEKTGIASMMVNVATGAVNYFMETTRRALIVGADNPKKYHNIKEYDKNNFSEFDN